MFTKAEAEREIGSWQCPKCYITSGSYWEESPGDSPHCCRGVAMIPYVFR